MEVQTSATIGLKRSHAQQLAAERQRSKIEKRNRETVKLNAKKEQARIAAAAAALQSPSQPSTATTPPPPSTPTLPTSESSSGSSSATAPSHSAGYLSQSSAETDSTPATTENATSSNSSPAQHPQPSSSPQPTTTMASSSSPALQLPTTPQGPSSASDDLLEMQKKSAAGFNKLNIELDKKAKKAAKQRLYRSAAPDTREHLPSRALKEMHVQRSRERAQRRKEEKEKLKEANRVKTLEAAVEKGVVDLEAVAREQREVTVAAMAGKEIVAVD